MILDSFRLTPDDCVVPLVPCKRTTMIDNLGSLLLGIIIVCGVVWASRRRMGQAVEQAAEVEQQKAGGGGGPKPVK